MDYYQRRTNEYFQIIARQGFYFVEGKKENRAKRLTQQQQAKRIDKNDNSVEFDKKNPVNFLREKYLPFGIIKSFFVGRLDFLHEY